MTRLSGHAIRQRRLDLALSQQQLADSIPMSTRLLQRIEGDDPASAAMVTVAQLLRLADTLSTSAAALLSTATPAVSELSSDAAVLASLLNASKSPGSATAIARVLGWQLTRVLAARDSVNGLFADDGVALGASVAG